MKTSGIKRIELPLPLYARGKVRDTYDLGDSLLMVASDRLSAFDVVFNEPIPYKGIVLTELSLFWFDFLKDIVPNHILSTKIPPGLEAFEPVLERRSMIVKKARTIPIECVVRGYIAGGGWKEYKEKGSVSGIKLPKGLQEADKLDEPIFTPTTKAVSGHDLSIDEKEAKRIVGNDLAEKIQEKSIELYKKANNYASRGGVIIADTKFEFGIFEDEMILIDEVLTPDASRFWPADKYSPGKSQFSFDKQYVRDYLETLNWNKQPPPPPLPKKVTEETTKKYIEAYEKITGKKFVE